MSCFEIVTNSLPVLGLCTLISWSYYVYVVIICICIIPIGGLKQISYLILYHLTFIMMMWSYIVTLFTKGKQVPPIYKPQRILFRSKTPQNENEILEKFCRDSKIVLYTTNRDGTIRFCKECQHVKPDRTHHCSTCNRCVLKMDHHCPWVNNCVGFSNHKQFVLLLFYGMIYCIFAFATSMEFVFNFMFGELETYYGSHITAMAICSGCIGIIVTALFCRHISLITVNVTTLEEMRATTFIDATYTFDLGSSKENFLEVFGNVWCLWFLPLKTARGDGCTFPIQQLA